MIEIHHQGDVEARVGELRLPHGVVETPVFIPVGTQSTIKAMTHERVSQLGYRLILSNTYHLYLRPGREAFERIGGLHRFTSWKHNFLTDSGGYQVFSLSQLSKVKPDGVAFQSHIDGSKHFFTPESVVDFQACLKSDIAMPLDVCTPSGITYQQAKDAMNLTHQWLKKSFQQKVIHEDWQGKLFGIVQGNFFQDLRNDSLQQVLELNPDGVAIGGLSVGESKQQFEETLGWISNSLPKDKPRYVMGIGTPDLILIAVEHGIDMFDCVYPTRVARNGCVMTPRGLLDLTKASFKDDDQPIQEGCTCTACSQYTRSYIRHLFRAKEILGPMLTTEHNLVFMMNLMRDIKNAIRQNRFLEFKKSFQESYQG